MIYKETIIINNVKLVHTYSDTNYIIKKGTNTKYIEAYDLESSKTTYYESDEELPKKEEEIKTEGENENGN